MRFFTNFYEDHLYAANQHDDHFDAFLSHFFEMIDRKEENETLVEEDCTLRLIARSPESGAATAIAQRSEDLNKRNANVKAIFADPVSADALFAWIDGDTPLIHQGCLENLRWAKNPSLLDAHEQLILGTDMCWSGDAMRRNCDQRYVMDLFEENASAATQLAYLSFEALWSASAPITKNQIKHISSASLTETFFDSETDTVLTELWPSHHQNTISRRH